MTARVLVAGLGNVFLGDDAFGVEVVRRLGPTLCDGAVTVQDFGIRGRDLAYALQEEYDAVILVDATSQGETPGTLYVLDPLTPPAPPSPTEGRGGEEESAEGDVRAPRSCSPPLPCVGEGGPGGVRGLLDPHAITPAHVLALARSLGRCPPARVIGCEPASLEPADELSPAVAAAVDRAAELVRRVACELLDRKGSQ